MARSKSQAAGPPSAGAKRKTTEAPVPREPHETVCDILTNIADCIMENMVMLVDTIPLMYHKKLAEGKKGKKRKATTADGEAEKKKRTTGYLLFGKDERDRLKQEGSALEPKAIMAELGRRWQELSPAEKEAFNAKAATLNGQPALPALAVEAPSAKKSKKTDEGKDAAPAALVAAPAPAAAVQVTESAEDEAKRLKREKKERKRLKAEKKARKAAAAAAAASAP